jgi:serine/threonine-protein kinase
MARCLDRDQKRRLRDIGEARIVLSNPAAVSSPLDEPAAASPAAPAMRSLWRRAMPLVLIAIASAAAAWTAARMLRPSTPLAATRFTMLLPEGQSFASVGRHMLAVSDDGSQLVYTALPGRLYRREMSEFDPKPIQGLEGLQNLTSPVFSPDGRSVAFFAAGDRTLKKIAISGGTPVTLCQADNPFGMSWQGDAILFGQGRKGIMRVSSNGGTSEVLVKPNDGEIMQSPQLLPGDQSILFTLATGQERPNLWDSATIVVQSLATGERHTLIQGGSDARYIPTGHLLYAIRGTVFGVSFDPRRLAVRGGPVPLIAGVRRTSGGAGGLPTGAANYAVSRTGSLSYIPGPTYSSVDQFDMIVAEGASVTRLKLPPTSYSAPRVSPDGRRVTFGIDDGNEASVWVYDLSETTTMRRVTFGAHDRVPIWSADGKRVVFQSDREGDRGIFVTPADGGGVVERLTTAEKQATHVPESWSPHGDVLLYSVVSGDEHTLRTLSVRTRQSNPVKGVRSSTPIGAVFSPDGRWIAYTATEIPRSTVYVEPFPPTGERYQLFTRAGDQPHHPVWSPDGKTLFYTPGPGGFEFVTVTTQPSFAFGKPTTVPRTFSTGAPGVRRLWDVMPNGKFIGLIPSGQTESGSAIAQSIHVVLNWTQELKGRVPSGQ